MKWSVISNFQKAVTVSLNNVSKHEMDIRISTENITDNDVTLADTNNNYCLL